MPSPELRVLDTSRGIAGAYAALLLHQAGGEVLRSGPPGDLEVTPTLVEYLRQGQQPVEGGGADPTAFGADVWICTPAPEEYAGLRAARADQPELIVVSITPYGLSGPMSETPASDLTLQADSGALAIRGSADRAPYQMGGRTIGWLAGTFAAASALSWWYGRLHGTTGTTIDISLAEVAHLGGANYLELYHDIGEGVGAPLVDPPRVLESPSIERTVDGWVGFNTNAPHQVVAFLTMIGRSDLAGQGAFVNPRERIDRHDEFQALVTAWASVRTTDEAIAAAVAHQVPVAPVCTGATVAELDHVIDRQNLVAAPSGASVPRRPWRIDGDLGPAPEPVPPVVTGNPRWQDRAPLPPVGGDRSAGRPLDGLRVLDLTSWWAGPAATGLLAALGADVIHVEGPAHMDGMRMVGLAFPGRSDWWELSHFFHAINPNKRSLALDLASAEGRELALELTAHVDVIVENFTPRVLDKLGLGPQMLLDANPEVVVVRMPAFGLSGPWRDRPGFAQNIEQASGLAYLTGQPDDQPRIQRGPCDPNGGVMAMVALLSVLTDRHRTGGCVIESALFDAALPLVAESIIEWSALGELLTRDGNRSRTAAPQGVYRCEGDDAWLALSAVTDAQWRALATLIGRPDLGADPTLATLEGRRAHHDELDGLLASWAGARGLDDAVEALRGVAVPVAPARDPRLASAHPQFVSRGYHEMVDHPVAGVLPIPTLPLRAEGVDRWITSPAPTFGQHTDQVLAEVLGLSDEALAELHEHGTIASRPVGV